MDMEGGDRRRGGGARGAAAVCLLEVDEPLVVGDVELAQPRHLLLAVHHHAAVVLRWWNRRRLSTALRPFLPRDSSASSWTQAGHPATPWW